MSSKFNAQCSNGKLSKPLLVSVNLSWIKFAFTAKRQKLGIVRDFDPRILRNSQSFCPRGIRVSSALLNTES